MSKAYPEWVFELWCYWAGCARSYSDADWIREHGIGKRRARLVVRLAVWSMDALRNFWHWRWETR